MGSDSGYLEMLWNARFTLGKGLSATVLISFWAIAIGSLIGVAGALALQYGNWLLRSCARICVDIIRGIPLLVLILFGFYGTSLLGWEISASSAGVVALGVFCGAHLSEVIRGALGSVPSGQVDAAKAMGLTFWQRLAHVVLPQAIRRTLPPWVNTATEIVKGSSLLAIIGVVDLLLATQQVVARTFAAVEFYLTAVAIYVIINLALSAASRALESRYAHLKY